MSKTERWIKDIFIAIIIILSLWGISGNTAQAQVGSYPEGAAREMNRNLDRIARVLEHWEQRGFK